MGSLLAQALKLKYEAEKKSELDALAAVIPIIVPSQFFKAFFYHILFYALMGPMSFGILICFENVTYIRNMGFLPGKDPDTMMYFMQQTMIWMLFMGSAFIAIKDRMEAANDDDPERKVLDLYPFYVSIVLVITRISIIGIRYGTSASCTLASMSTDRLTYEAYYERLLRLAWIIMPPEVCMREIEVAMIRTGVSDKFFKFRSLTPIYPTSFEKLTDSNYWANHKWSFSNTMKEEKQEKAVL